MGRIYEKPPLIEAICEFRFETAQSWDWTVPGLIYAQLRKDYPKKRERHGYQIRLQEEREETKHSLRKQVDRMQFLREDEKALVQVGRDILAVNRLRPYPDWKTFEAAIARALDVYREVAGPEGFRRIGLRYINRIEMPEKGRFEIETYLQAAPKLPDSLTQPLADWAQRAEMPFEEKNGVLAIQSGSVQDSEKPGQATFMLDLDFRTLQAQDVTLDGAMAWVEQAHGAIEEAFEACITDRTRELFQEVGRDPRAEAHG